MKNIFYVLCFTILFISCNNNEFKTSSKGLEYKFIEKDKSPTKINVGDIVIMDLRYTTEGDSVLFNSIEESRQFRMMIKEPTYDASIDDALTMMHVGDSAIFKVNAMEFYAFSRGAKQKPSFIEPQDKLIFYVRIRSVLDMGDYEKEKTEVKLSKEEEETELLTDFIEKTNITVKPTKSGLYYVEEKEGKGNFPKIGDVLVVHYTGKFINGQIFDTSLRTGKPIEFKYGHGNVIAGWEEGLSKMKKGGKAQFVIPSYLAYGDKRSGPVPAFSTLVFDVELVDIK